MNFGKAAICVQSFAAPAVLSAVAEQFALQRPTAAGSPAHDPDAPTAPAPAEPVTRPAPGARVDAEAASASWDSELPTGVITDRPLLPRPPKTPHI